MARHLAALAAAVLVSVEPMGPLLRGALDQHDPPAREGLAWPAPRHCDSAACWLTPWCLNGAGRDISPEGSAS